MLLLTLIWLLLFARHCTECWNYSREQKLVLGTSVGDGVSQEPTIFGRSCLLVSLGFCLDTSIGRPLWIFQRQEGSVYEESHNKHFLDFDFMFIWAA